MYTQLELNHLKWQCRRGMKELDLIIEPFFEQDFLNQPEDVQKTFIKILDESDLMLFRWLLRGEKPADPQYLALIDIMLQSHENRRLQQ